MTEDTHIGIYLPQPPVMERMPSQQPSLTHSVLTDDEPLPPVTFSDKSDSPMTPPVITRDLVTEVADHFNHESATETKFLRGRLTFSRSMQSLRGRAKFGASRDRSASSVNENVTDEVPPVPPVPFVFRSKIPIAGSEDTARNNTLNSKVVTVTSKPVTLSTPTIRQQPVRPTAPPHTLKKSSSIASFVRKITGRGPTPLPPIQQTHVHHPATFPSVPVATWQMSTQRRSTAPELPRYGSAGSRNNAVRPIDVCSPPSAQLPNSLPSIPPHNTSGIIANSVTLTQATVDPAEIPLPLSRENSQQSLSGHYESEPESTTAESLTVLSTSDTENGTEELDSDLFLKRNRQLPNLAGYSDEEDENEESSDVVPSLTVRIPSNNHGQFNGYSPTTPSTVNDFLVTPTSPGFQRATSRDSLRDYLPSSNTPSRTAPVGTGGDLGLKRNESKWRRSVAGLGSSLNRRGKPPPTSYDSYMAKQAELATRRQSCCPTIHSTASISAELAEVRDNEARGVMETFFLS